MDKALSAEEWINYHYGIILENNTKSLINTYSTYLLEEFAKEVKKDVSTLEMDDGMYISSCIDQLLTKFKEKL
jgi:ferritin-like protein